MKEPDQTEKGTVHTLLTEAAFRAALGGVCERKFKELRAAGVICEPLELGPRVPRWTVADFEATVARLPRRQKQGEPTTLSQARRAQIERAKRGTA